MFYILFTILSFSQGLIIQSPTINNLLFDDQMDVSYSIANFGHVPYGKKMSGQLFIPPILLPTENETWRFCNNSIVNPESGFFKNYGDKWIIVRRGDCPFTQKAINAQNYGAKLLIIVDNKDEKPQQLMMADDGNGYQIDIPSILISKTDGEKVITYLTTHPNTYLVASIEFALNATNNKTDVIFGLNIENRDTFKLLSEFKPIYNEFKNSINLTIYYEILRCFSCEQSGWTSEIEDCLGGGRYCQFDPNGAEAGNGADVIREQLRQTCLWDLDQDLWWEYMDYFNFECNKPNAYVHCMSKKVDKEKFQQVEKCVASSYDQTQTNQKLDTNKILEKHFMLRYSTGIIFYPGASINNQAYRGNIEAFEIKEAICASMIIQHPSCETNIFINPIYEETRNSYFWLIIVVIISSVLFILFIIFIFRRKILDQTNKDIKIKVNEEISRYVQFYESKAEK